MDERDYPSFYDIDIDFLDDTQDMIEDWDSYQELWRCYRNPSEKASMLEEKWAKYAAKFDRCRKCEDKYKEIKAHRARLLKEQQNGMWKKPMPADTA
jgi:hypothetical protein